MRRQRADDEAAGPARATEMAPLDPNVLIEIRDLRVHFHLAEGLLTAVHGIHLVVRKNRILVVTGESGCRKSMTARAIMGIIPSPPGMVTEQIYYNAAAREPPINLTDLDPKGEAYREVRGNQISMIFQEPMSMLESGAAIGNQIGKVIALHQRLPKKAAGSGGRTAGPGRDRRPEPANRPVTGSSSQEACASGP